MSWSGYLGWFVCHLSVGLLRKLWVNFGKIFERTLPKEAISKICAMICIQIQIQKSVCIVISIAKEFTAVGNPTIMGHIWEWKKPLWEIRV